jgi:glycosyltransferase involved in cell wall biosynthesis
MFKIYKLFGLSGKIHIIKKSGLFDEIYYLKSYPDVRKSDIDPIKHYILHGAKEGRNPSPYFQTSFYLEKYPDVAQSGINPLLHYILHGSKEARWPNPEFDSGYYLLANPDVKKARLNPLLHYIKYGQYEGRKTNLNNEYRLLAVQNEPIKLIRILRVINKENVKKSIDYIRRYGLKAFVRKLKMKFLLRKTDKDFTKINIPKIVLPDITEKELKKYNEINISVIIPTKNAGKEFEYLLKILRNQKGFNSIEIVIVDSGSTDETLSIAKEYNSKIINILPEKFSHSYARNIGAENALGNYLLFTVQDALPPIDTWLYNLMVVLKNNDIAAVSCAEVPREDADLFYRVICWNHYNFLEVKGNDKVSEMPKTVNCITLRKNGQLSDIACLISREKFMNYKYRNDYAEDLDLGIRLIKDGNKIAFLSSTRIIHSHNRPAYYFLKRGYVDNLFLSTMFNDFPIPEINYNDFVLDIIFTYNFIKEVIINEISKLNFPLRSDEIEIFIKEEFQQAFKFTYPNIINVDENKYIDNKFRIFIKNLFDEEYKKKDKTYNGFLINSLLDFLKITFEYINNTYEFIDEDLIEDLKICIYKEYSLLCGAHLAYCYLNSSQKEKQKLQKIHEELKEGI